MDKENVMTETTTENQVNNIETRVENNQDKASSTSKKKAIPKKRASKPTSRPSTKSINTKPRHLIIGHQVANESGWTFSYSESINLREILIDFVKTVDSTANKRRTILFTNIISSLTGNSQAIPIAFGLIEEMFGYKIDFISEITAIYRDVDFTKNLTQKMKSLNEPLPF